MSILYHRVPWIFGFNFELEYLWSFAHTGRAQSFSYFAAIFFHGRSMRQTALTAFDWQYVANNSPARPQIILIYRLQSVMDVSLTEFEREGKHSSYRGR